MGTSDNNCKATFYTITKRGRKKLSQDSAYWHRPSGVGWPGWSPCRMKGASDE